MGRTRRLEKGASLSAAGRRSSVPLVSGRPPIVPADWFLRFPAPDSPSGLMAAFSCFPVASAAPNRAAGRSVGPVNLTHRTRAPSVRVMSAAEQRTSPQPGAAASTLDLPAYSEPVAALAAANPAYAAVLATQQVGCVLVRVAWAWNSGRNSVHAHPYRALAAYWPNPLCYWPLCPARQSCRW